MSKVVEEAIHNVLDQIITEMPLEFPNGERFINELETELKFFQEDGEIDSWAIMPLASEGFKIVITVNSVESHIIRNRDGGKPA